MTEPVCLHELEEDGVKPPMPEILLGDARALPLPDESVDLIVTSPPYFGLRDYGTDAQIGSEATPQEFISALLECTREMVRVLKPSGSIFVNLGDKYVNPSASGAHRGGQIQAANYSDHKPVRGFVPDGMRAKSLMMLPERYRIAAVDELGLIARAVIVWAKPNGMPESVTDRVRRSHEDWVHLTKNPRYFASVDEVREEHSPVSVARSGRSRFAPDLSQQGVGSPNTLDPGQACNPRGKLPGSVWEITTQPLKVPAHLGIDHFAAFPMEWPRRLIQGWSPREVCTVCGEGRWPVVARSMGADAQGRVGTRHGGDHARLAHSTERKMLDGLSLRTITGYACACTPRTSHRGKRGDWREGREVMPDHLSDDFHSPGNAVPRRPGGFGTKVPASEGEWEYHLEGWTTPPSTPGVVLDPFSGTGTTALVATMLGRRGVGIELNPDYVRLAEWRAGDPKERARAAGLDPDAVAKVPHQLPGQFDLFDLGNDGAAS